MSTWYRIPEWCALSDDDSEALAAMWILGRWHFNVAPSVSDVKRRTGWGWDRSSTFASRLWTWAGEAGAARPEFEPGKTGSKRGGKVKTSGITDVEQTPVVDESRGEPNEAAGKTETPSCAPVSTTREREEDKQTQAAAPDVPVAASDEQAAPTPDKAHPWTPKGKDRHGHSGADLEAMALRCIAAIRGGGTVNPARCGTDAKVVFSLWSALSHPPPAELAADLELVAAWAQLSPDRAAAHDIRAEDWPTGTDRSRAMATLCRRAQWGDRLAAAQAWDAAGRPTTSASPAPPPDDPLLPDLIAVLEDLTINQGDPDRCADPRRARRALDRLYKVGGGIDRFSSTPAEWRPKAYRETAATMLRHAAAERAKAREAANG